MYFNKKTHHLFIFALFVMIIAVIYQISGCGGGGGSSGTAPSIYGTVPGSAKYYINVTLKFPETKQESLKRQSGICNHPIINLGSPPCGCFAFIIFGEVRGHIRNPLIKNNESRTAKLLPDIEYYEVKLVKPDTGEQIGETKRADKPQTGNQVTVTFWDVPEGNIKLLVKGYSGGKVLFAEGESIIDVSLASVADTSGSGGGNISGSGGLNQEPVVLPTGTVVDGPSLPRITEIRPKTLQIGDACTIIGSGFGGNRDDNKSCVYFGGVKVTDYIYWSDTYIVCRVPKNVSMENLNVCVCIAGNNGANGGSGGSGGSGGNGAIGGTIISASSPSTVVSVQASSSGGGGGGGGSAPTYKVLYNGNGNTGGTAPVDNSRYAQGDSVTLCDKGSLVKTAYSFIGWNTQADGNGTDRAAGTTFSMGSSDVTYYAKWTLSPTYTVTYNGNGNTGGTVPLDSNNYLNGATVTVRNNTGSLYKDGSAFSGWNTQADGNGTNRPVGSTFSMGAANVILYAKWAAPADSTTLIEVPAITAGNYVTVNLVINGTLIQRIDSYYLGKYETTATDFCAFLNSMKSQGSDNLSEGGATWWNASGDATYNGIIDNGASANPRYTVRGGFANRPISYVSWYGAVAYCNWLTIQKGLTVGDQCYGGYSADGSARFGASGVNYHPERKGYRLPTEVEWEYASRFNTLTTVVTTDYFYGVTFSGNYCWYSGNSNGNHQDVGGKLANGLGFYDMYGNVFERIGDNYSGTYPYDNYPGGSSVMNPKGATSDVGGKNYRGGCFDTITSQACSSTYREGGNYPFVSWNSVGFRIAKTK